MSIIKTLIATLGLLATSGLTILAAPPATANHTTDHQPAIDVEKFLTSLGPTAGDLDAFGGYVNEQGGTDAVTIRVTNTGDYPLSGITVTDQLVNGNRAMTLSCAPPATLAVGASFDCTGVIAGPTTATSSNAATSIGLNTNVSEARPNT